MTWPLHSSTLGPRCIHAHRNMRSSAQTLTLSNPALHICFNAATSVFSTATVERLAHHMTEPRDGFSPHSCFASRVFCPVSIQSGQRQPELSTKQRITVPCYTCHGQLLHKGTKHVALATLCWNNCIGLPWENLACAFSKYWRMKWQWTLRVNVSYFHIHS